MKKYPLHIFCSLCLLFTINICRAQKNYSDSLLAANEYIYRFRFQSADSAIQRLNNNHPHDYLPKLLSANYYWWLIISGHDTPQNRKTYFQNLSYSLGILSSTKNGSSHDSLYALITTFAYKARIHSLNNEYFSALKQLNNCIDLLKTSFGKEQDYEWFLLSSGLYNYYIEAVKKNYPFLIPYLIFLPSGQASLGLNFLKLASEKENFLLKTEAHYFLMKIFLEEEKNYSEAGKYAEQLLHSYPGNLLYRYYRFKTFLEENNLPQATTELGLLKYQSESNLQVSDKQKSHYYNIAITDLQNYYLKKK